jgi:hypothetical protein
MSLANYSDLQTSVANWTHRSDLTSLIPDFVTMAEARISRDLRLRRQITSGTLTCVAGTQSVALPSDWLEFENLSVETNPSRQLVYVPIEHLDAKYPTNYSGVPAVFTIEGDNVLFGPTPDSAYVIDNIYYARFPSLITDSTNWLMTNHPNIYLFATLIEAFLYMQNQDQAAVFTARYQQGVQQLQEQDDRATHSGSALRVKVV